jgi:hypothetical protein
LGEVALVPSAVSERNVLCVRLVDHVWVLRVARADDLTV